MAKSKKSNDDIDNSGLNVKQKAFCNLYVSKEFFGNGVESYIEAYNVDLSKPGAYMAAKTNASRLLTNANLLKYLNTLLDNEGLNDQFVDKQLLLVITQNADFSSKVAAIKEFNKLRSRITDKIDHTTKGESMTVFNIGYSENPSDED
jgi:phage terminase small subunit